MKQLASILLAVGLLIALPMTVGANVGGGMTLDISFHGPCDVQGYVEVDNTTDRFVVFQNQDNWSASNPIHHELGATPIADPGHRLVLRFFAADHATVLFKTDDFTHHGSEQAYFSDFIGSLDCSVVPYRVLFSDTAVASPRNHDWIVTVGWLALALAIIFGSRSFGRRSLGEG